jgi:predicted acyltransferase
MKESEVAVQPEVVSDVSPRHGAESPPAHFPPSQRLLSLDALRGFNMFWIIGGAELFAEIAKRIDNRYVTAVTDNLSKHVKWEGIHWHDMIFPLFLFIIGVTLPFSLGRRMEQGTPRAELIKRVLKRTALMLLLGLVYSGLFDLKGFEHQRIMGVLQRLALGYCFAAIIYLNTRVRGQIIALVSCLVGYWLAMRFIPVPGFNRGDFSEYGNFANYIDRVLFAPGQLYEKYGDPEGIFSTIPAIGTALMGVLAGQWLRSSREGNEKARMLVIAGLLGIGLGYLWSIDFPVIKKIWTSSYVLVAGGWSLLLLATFYWLIDVKGWTKWTFFFVVIGLNPITIYIADRIIDFDGIAKFFIGGSAKMFPLYGPILLLAVSIAIRWLFLLHLHRQKIYLRI